MPLVKHSGLVADQSGEARGQVVDAEGQVGQAQGAQPNIRSTSKQKDQTTEEESSDSESSGGSDANMTNEPSGSFMRYIKGMEQLRITPAEEFPIGPKINVKIGMMILTTKIFT